MIKRLLITLFCLIVPFGLRADPGDLDTTFGSSGLFIQDFGPGTDTASALVIQPDEKIVAVGFFERGADFDVHGIRLDTNGVLDTAFNTTGRVTEDFGSGNDDFANDVTLQADGKIVVAGRGNNGSDDDFFVARFNPDGSLDTSFGGNGFVLTDVAGGADDRAVAVAVQADGKIVAAGRASIGGSNDLGVVRYEANGDLDTTFGTGGIITHDTSPGAGDIINGMVLQADGKIVVAGAFSGGDFDSLVARLESDGPLDATFGTNGIAINDFGTGNADFANAVALQGDGKVVIAGRGDNGSDDTFYVASYSTDGTLDTSFGSGAGFVMTDVAPGENDVAFAVAIYNDGRIVAGGKAPTAADDDLALVRYEADGSLDTSFGSNGIVTADPTGDDEEINDIAIQSDGKIVAAMDLGTGEELMLARFEGNTADLSIAKSANLATVDVGDQATYTIGVTNNGPNNSGLVTVTDALPAQLDFVSATADQGTCLSNGSVTCELGTIGNGNTVTVTLTVTANDGGDIDNTATVDPGQVVDPDDTNNTVTASISVTGSAGTVSTGGCQLHAAATPQRVTFIHLLFLMLAGSFVILRARSL